MKQFKMTKRQWNELLEKSPYVIESSEGGVWVPTKTVFDGRNAGEYYPDDEEALEKLHNIMILQTCYGKS